ncbi:MULTISPECIES: hypothetical protein [Limosilactobacillus]|uniref:hypothetical protein n=1 Tax=Limosilactobacillus TaxID=2742598 RepID=UPI00128BD4F9|nr:MULTISPECIES: hypothetical protein [Limosilactobacillus]MQB69902.1 hypothetical protein [Limosilactobacillus reuteri]MQC05252.1 hypothetical protein [Limosilactobacillus reuteri]
MNNAVFNKEFQKLSCLFDDADDAIREYNLLLVYLQKNPPKNPESSIAWQEVKDLQPFTIHSIY